MEKTLNNQSSLLIAQTSIASYAQEQAQALALAEMPDKVLFVGSRSFNYLATKILVDFARYHLEIAELESVVSEARADLSADRKELKKAIDKYGLLSPEVRSYQARVERSEEALEWARADKKLYESENVDPCKALTKAMQKMFAKAKAKSVAEKRRALSEFFQKVYGFGLNRKTQEYLVVETTKALKGSKAIKSADSVHEVADVTDLGYRILSVAVHSGCTTKKFIDVLTRQG